jgi:hypothetical protein
MGKKTILLLGAAAATVVAPGGTCPDVQRGRATGARIVD